MVKTLERHRYTLCEKLFLFPFRCSYQMHRYLAGCLGLVSCRHYLDAEGLKIGGEGEWLLAEVLEDGSISIEDSGTKMIFARDVNTYIGDWQLTLMEEDGVQIDAAEYGLVMILTLNEDGTAAMAYDGEESDEMAWMLDAEGLKIGGEGEWLLAEVLEDGSISIEDSGTKMIFGRAASESVSE